MKETKDAAAGQSHAREPRQTEFEVVRTRRDANILSGGVKDTVVNAVAQLIGVVAGLATQSVLAWWLAPEGRGTYGICIAIASISAVVFTLGADRAIQFHLISKRISTAQAVSLSVSVGLVGSILACAVVLMMCFAGRPMLAVMGNGALADVSPGDLWSILPVVPVFAMNISLQLTLLGLRHFVAVALLTTLAVVTQLVLHLIFLWGLDWGVEGALLAYFGGNAVSVAASLWCLRRWYGVLADLPSVRICRDVAAYALRYLPARLGNVVNAHIVILVLAVLASKSEVGLFSLAVVLMGRLLLVSESVNRTLQPRVGADARGRPELVSQCCRVLLLAVGGLIGLLLCTSGVLVPLLFSAEFRGSTFLLWILAPGVWVRGAAKPMLTYFIGVNRPEIVSLSMVAQFVTCVAGLPLLFGTFGLSGAAAAATFSYVVGTAVLVFAFRSISGLGFLETWLWTRQDTSLLRKVAHAIPGVPWLARRGRRPECQEPRRRTESLDDRFVKIQAQDLAVVEAEKTRQGAAIGSRTGLFLAPSVLATDRAAGRIEFEQLHDLVPLWRFLQRQEADRAIASQVGEALAAIHEELALPESLRVPLPREWCCGQTDSPVWLHADFNAMNVCVCARTNRLVITDWAASDLCGGRATVGPWCFDVAWFATSVLFRRFRGFQHVRDAHQFAQQFVESYCAAREPAVTVGEWRRYMSDVSDELVRVNQRKAGSLISKLTGLAYLPLTAADLRPLISDNRPQTVARHRAESKRAA